MFFCLGLATLITIIKNLNTNIREFKNVQKIFEIDILFYSQRLLFGGIGWCGCCLIPFCVNGKSNKISIKISFMF